MLNKYGKHFVAAFLNSYVNDIYNINKIAAIYNIPRSDAWKIVLQHYVYVPSKDGTYVLVIESLATAKTN